MVKKWLPKYRREVEKILTVLTWCRAVSPSMLAVSMSAPLFWSLSTSSLSEAAQAAKKTQPSVNWILCDLRLGSEGSVLVSLSDHRFSCSALLKRADELRFSSEVIQETWSLQSVSSNVLFLAQSKREGRKWSACVYSTTAAANFLLKKRNGLELAVALILRHLFHKFEFTYVFAQWYYVCSPKFGEKSLLDYFL